MKRIFANEVILFLFVVSIMLLECAVAVFTYHTLKPESMFTRFLITLLSFVGVDKLLGYVVEPVLAYYKQQKGA